MADAIRPRGPVLVLAPHADDESLGCGALLSDLWTGGGRAHVACVTDGAASHPNSRTHPPGRLVATRRSELREAVRLLGGTDADLTFLDLPDAAAHRVAGPGIDLARSVAALADALGAATLIAPSPLDAHCDHEATAEAAMRVAAMRLLLYPVWSRWTAGGIAPVPEGWRPVAGRVGGQRKHAAIEAHRSQRGLVVRDDPKGFTMPEGFAALFAAAPETYFEAAR
jgi:LmbE family N-acetylglucosaminyl deacetylase